MNEVNVNDGRKGGRKGGGKKKGRERKSRRARKRIKELHEWRKVVKNGK